MRDGGAAFVSKVVTIVNIVGETLEPAHSAVETFFLPSGGLVTGLSEWTRV